MEKVGIQNREGLRIHLSEKSNTIAITTQNPLLTTKLLSIDNIPKGDKIYEFHPYAALSQGQSRGVIHLHGQGLAETPESLLEGLECKTHKILAAPIIGKSGRTVLITFEGKTAPRYVCFIWEAYPVSEYRPRPLVCFACHELGHKSEVCPNKTKRCGECGHSHDGMDDCTLPPKCRNCEGPHSATSAKCPKRKIPDRRKPPVQRKSDKRPSQFNNGPPKQPRWTPTASAFPAC